MVSKWVDEAQVHVAVYFEAGNHQELFWCATKVALVV